MTLVAMKRKRAKQEPYNELYESLDNKEGSVSSGEPEGLSLGGAAG